MYDADGFSPFCRTFFLNASGLRVQNDVELSLYQLFFQFPFHFEQVAELISILEFLLINFSFNSA
jgi:hypothetical protein